jgi:ribosomal subunit interface protein
MQIEYTGRQMEVPPPLRALAERKLRKLERALPRITHVHVVCTADGHRQAVEVTVQSPHLTLAAQEESPDLERSLASVMDKLIRQAQRHLGRWRRRKEGQAGRVEPGA